MKASTTASKSTSGTATAVAIPAHPLLKIPGWLLLAGVLSVAVGVSTAALAQGQGNRGQGKNDNEHAGQHESVTVNIGYEAARRLAVTNRLTGYEGLPPGIRKNLARGKPLPPGLARKGVPNDMLNSLPQIGGHEWQIAGQDLVLVSLGTQLVVDILNNVFQ